MRSFSRYIPRWVWGCATRALVGPLRLDFGLRLADLGCDRTAREVTTQNAAVGSGWLLAHHVLNTPRCGFLFWDSIPMSVNLSIGEAY